MNQTLSEINQMYHCAQVHLFPALSDTNGHLAKSGPKNRAQALQTYQLARQKLDEIYHSLTAPEIIEGYEKGSILLRWALGATMRDEFKPAYIPLMRDSIKSGDRYAAPHFLQTLAEQLGQAAAPLMLESLSSEFEVVRNQALAIVKQVELWQAIPTLQQLSQSPNHDLSAFAKHGLHFLQGSPESSKGLRV